MPKVRPIGKMVDQAATLLQKLVRMKAADQDGIATCVTCNKRAHWKEMDGGHYVSRTYSKHKLNEENVHCQCPGCNRFSNRSIDDYFHYMVSMYGYEHVKRMTDTKRDVVKWNRAELEDTIKDFKARIKEQEARLGQ
jgi:hypothetical protein